MPADDVPDEITLSADTIAALMADAALMDEMQQAGDLGTAELIEWLDAHGLRWRPGGSDPAAAFADAAEHGGLVFGGPMFELEQTVPGEGPGDRGSQRRKMARKAARKARRTTRRHR